MGVFSCCLLSYSWKPKPFQRVSNMESISRIFTSKKLDWNKEEKAGPRLLQHVGDSNETALKHFSIMCFNVTEPWKTDLGKSHSLINLSKNSTHSMSIVLRQKALSFRSIFFASPLPYFTYQASEVFTPSSLSLNKSLILSTWSF